MNRRSRKYRIFLVLLSSFLMMSTFYLHASPLDSTKVLVLYDSKSRNTAQMLQRLLVSYNKEVTLVSERDYIKGMEAEYAYRILTSPTPFEKGFVAKEGSTVCIGGGYEIVTSNLEFDTVLETKANISISSWEGPTGLVEELPVITEFAGKAKGNITLSLNRKYPFRVFEEGIYFVPYVDEADVSFLGLGQLFKEMFGEEIPSKLYITIEDITPFSNLNNVVAMTEALYKSGIPFIAKVGPVYKHHDYPAFERYMKVLREIQAKNGTIILESPIERQEIEVTAQGMSEDIDEKINVVIKAFKEQGIEVFKMGSQPYPISYELLEEISSTTRAFTSLPFEATLTYSLPHSEQELSQLIGEINSKWLKLYDIQPDSDYKEWEEEAAKEPTQVVPEETFQGFFSIGNKLLFPIVGISCIIFIIILIIGRHLYKQKFYSKK